MKILRIRLLNLNSLRGEHLVDFEQGPLAQAGLFLIAGPTGAGKSTLLDALTLALYGRAARYAKDPNPEDMMTRLCGECRAEVEFEVASGRYRAEWHLRRARGKADGAIQAARRYVYDASGQVLTQHIRDAEVMIEKLVGLDYQRFLRSVLLAQGEFARFLHADPDERAELLESLTGTGIYGELSQLTHEETTRRETVLAGQEKELGRVALMTAEQRDELTRRVVERETAQAGQRADLEKLNRAQAQARELAEHLERERGLMSDQAAAEQRARAAETELAQLARHRLALPLAEDLSRLELAGQQLREQERGLGLARRARDQARQDWVGTLLAAGDFAGALVRQGADALKQAEQQVQAAASQRQQAADWLKDHEPDRSLNSGLPGIAGQLTSLATTRKDLAKGCARRETLAAGARQQAEKITAATKALTEARALLGRRELEKAAAGQQLESLLQGKPLTVRAPEIEALRMQFEAIGKLILWEESARDQRQSMADNQARLGTLQIGLEQARQAAVEAGAKKEAAERALVLRQDHLQAAKLVASFQEHRAALKPGEACPLCGATEHPFAGPGRAPLAEPLLEAEVGRAREELTSAEKNWRAAERAATQLSADHANLTQTQAKAAGDLDALRRRADRFAQAGGLEAGSLETLAALQIQKQEQIETLRQELAEITRANQALDQWEKAHVQAEHESHRADQARVAAQDLFTQGQAQIQEQAQAIATLDQRLATTLETLAAGLQPYQVAVPEAGGEPGLLGELTARRAQFQAREESLRQAGTTLEAARHSVETAKQALSVLEQRTNPLLTEAGLHAANPDLPTPGARATERANWTTWEAAEQGLRRRADALTSAEAATVQRQQEFERASETARRMTTQMEARLEGSAFATLTALRAARLLPEVSERLERLEQQLRREAETLQVRLGEVRGRIRELRAAHAAEGVAVPQLAERLQALQHATEELAAAIGLDQDALRRDQAERERQAAIAVELERERGRVQVWQRLHGLIGSHDGRKFRRYAQGLSLDVLVEHANRHLARLTDRYRMRRRGGEELALEIEDLYQAGVTRPMASLSGGESFLASLALALGLAALAGRSVRIDSLFIDEGFGSLDADTLDTAISALETLRQDAKTIGVVSHVDLLKERITTQILVEKRSAGASSFRIVA